MTDLRVPRTDPYLPPGMTDRDVECPGDEDDGSCPDCGGPLNEDCDCCDDRCREYQARQQMEREFGGWHCSQACGWCGRC